MRTPYCRMGSIRAAWWSVILFSSGVAIGAPHRPAPPTRYSCVVETVMYRGKSKDALSKEETLIQRVWHHDRAYRIETTRQFHAGPRHLGSSSGAVREIILNNGDGSNTEFYYWPDRKRAKLSLPSVHFLFSQKYPERWKREFGGHVIRISGNLLRTINMPGPPGSKGRTFFSTWEVGRREKFEGRDCHVLFQWRKQVIDAASKKTDPNTRSTVRSWVWVKGGVVLRYERLAEWLGDQPPQPRAERRITTVREFRLNPPVTPSRFELPAGITCEIFGDYPTRLPKGVKPLVIPGPGLRKDSGGATRVLP
jgi:hypothetical protein